MSNEPLPQVEYEIRYDLSINAKRHLYKKTTDIKDAVATHRQLEVEGRQNVETYKIVRVKMGAYVGNQT